jgi:hypothetical protein
MADVLFTARTSRRCLHLPRSGDGTGRSVPVNSLGGFLSRIVLPAHTSTHSTNPSVFHHGRWHGVMPVHTVEGKVGHVGFQCAPVDWPVDESGDEVNLVTGQCAISSAVRHCVANPHIAPRAPHALHLSFSALERVADPMEKKKATTRLGCNSPPGS